MRTQGRLQNRIAVITGAASGIGQATAIRFAEEGAHVLIANLPTQKRDADATAGRVRGLGRNAEVVGIDVTREDQVDEMTEAAMAAFGRIDILVSAAGIEQDPQSRTRAPFYIRTVAAS